MVDEDTCSYLFAEERMIRTYEIELKNKILGMSNAERKATEWKKHFGVQETLQTNEVY